MALVVNRVSAAPRLPGRDRLRGRLVKARARVLGAILQVGAKLTSWIAGTPSGSPPPTGGRFLFLQFEPALGWALHGTPVFKALRQARPDALIVVGCSSPNYEVLSSNPNIDHVVRLESPQSSILGAWLGAWRTARRYQVNCVVTTAWNRTKRISAIAALLGAGRPVGFTPIPGIYAGEAEYDRGRSVIDNNLEVVRLLGDPAMGDSPEIFCEPEHLAEADALLARFGLSGDQPVVAIVSQGSGGQPSEWFDDRFAELGDQLADQGCRTVFLGSAGQAARINAIRGTMRRPGVSLAGLTSIPVLAAVMASIDMAVTLDTGTMHVGWAVGLPMVVIAPAWQPALDWLPLNRAQIAILRRNDIWCAHCLKTTCATRECMEETRVLEAVSAATNLLGRYPASPAARAGRRDSLLPKRGSVSGDD